MTDIALDTITSGYSLSKINNNFSKVQNVINDEVVHSTGGNNVMNQDLDLNGHALLNVKTNIGNPDSIVTLEEGDRRYYNVSGDKLEGTMNANNNSVVGLPAAVAPSSPVRKQEFDAESVVRQATDAALQAQINGTSPPMASAFSPISWHDQTVATSVTIPANKNAWSFGPVMTIGLGQTITVGSGSFWTIANGQVQQ